MQGDRPSDLDLFEAWCAGDRKAGHELFTRYFHNIRRFFANKVENEVEDLVQRTFTACVESRDRVLLKSSFRAYLYGIARNILRQHFRARNRAGTPFDVDEHSVCDSGAGISMILAARQEQRLLLEALRRLPLDHQTLLELYFWEDLSAREIAECFDLPENTIRSRIRRGKRMLSERMEELATSPVELESARSDLERWAASLRDPAGQ
jgi:RNA polymerase sigma factor (sigma-70 family)